MASSCKEKDIESLVSRGFSPVEARMALEDCRGNIQAATDNLLSGRYSAPPAYQAQEPFRGGDSSNADARSGSACGFLSKIFKRGKSQRSENDPPSAPVLDFDALGAAPDFSAIVGLPPPYELLNKDEKMKSWEKENNIVHINNNKMQGPSQSMPAWSNEPNARCSVCYSKLITEVIGSDGISIAQDVIHQDGQFHHYECFTRKYSPKCAQCFFPLAGPDKDHELSGRYMKYEGKDYHVECYERYAGPRCSICFNVIIERPNGEYSGHWLVDSEHDGEKMHVECYQRKLYTQWRARQA